MDKVRLAAQEELARRNKILPTDIKCGITINEVIESGETTVRAAVDSVRAERNIIEVEDIIGGIETAELLPVEEATEEIPTPEEPQDPQEPAEGEDENPDESEPTPEE